MRNVKNLFGMAVMATALVACSSNDDLTSNGHEGDQTGEAYASSESICRLQAELVWQVILHSTEVIRTNTQ